MIFLSILGKKGFAMQFNWLFVLLGGAVILAFFFTLINNLIHGEEVSSKIKATQDIDSLIKINMASENTQKTIPLGFRTTLVFFADPDSTFSEYSVEGSPKTARYDYYAVFSPNRLEGDELVISTQLFETPFKSMSLIYLTNKEIEYVLLGDSPLILGIRAMIPEHITTRSIFNEQLSSSRLANYPDRNYDRTVFIANESTFNNYLAGVSFNLFKKPEQRIFAVTINPGPGTIFSYGNITFYHYDANQGFISDGKSAFFDQQLLLGGIISHDKAIYDNNLRKVLKRINLLSNLYKIKVARYFADVAELARCSELYADSVYLLDYVARSSTGDGALNYEDISLLFSLSNQLKSNNYVIVTKNDCPSIY